MAKNIQAIRGMNDYLPNETASWQCIEGILKQVLNSYGYSEIRLPIIEQAMLFRHAIGETTDVIGKAMYTFKDRNGNSLALRPEGTAGCVRAGIEHGLLYNQIQRLWYIGPMFRYERPQKGRYRQFYQLGVETFGSYGPSIDAELIMINARWWRALGIINHVSLELNSIGSPESRHSYCDALTAFLEQHKKMLNDDCKRCIYHNPLRILDSKNPKIRMLLNNAPSLNQYLDHESRKHFIELCNLLKSVGISYSVNNNLVRGLDYYNRTVFEWVVNDTGSQRTICAGGRYDNLVKQFCGHSTPAIGCAIGMERLVSLVQNVNPKFKIKFLIDVYLVVHPEEQIQSLAICLAEQIRNALPKIRMVTNYSNNSFKKQFARADKLGARLLLIIDKSNISIDKITIIDLCVNKRTIVTYTDIVAYLHNLLKE